MRYAVIMAGGPGTRLWPMSTRARPKQLLPLIGGRCLLDIAVRRPAGAVESSRVYICTGTDYIDKIQKEMPTFPAHQILGEPCGRDTVNAVGFSAAILSRLDADATMAVLTADHLIDPLDTFTRCLEAGFDTVEQSPQTLLTFGITPTYPATGFGYIQRGRPLAAANQALRVQAFREKPDRKTAEQYLSSGEYLWNSGMFVWKVRTILEKIQQYAPQTHAGVMEIARHWNQPDYHRTLAEIYPSLPKVSIDYAVMEKSADVAVIPMPVQWLDVGSWGSFAATLSGDAAGNKSAGCRLAALDSHGVLAVSQDDHLIATIGLQDIAIVHTPDATLVCSTAQAENIKQMVSKLQNEFGDRYV